MKTDVVVDVVLNELGFRLPNVVRGRRYRLGMVDADENDRPDPILVALIVTFT
jgi:hypothetical protein